MSSDALQAAVDAFRALSAAERRKFLTRIQTKEPRKTRKKAYKEAVAKTLRIDGVPTECDCYAYADTQTQFYVFSSETLEFLGLYDMETEELDTDVNNPFT